MALVNKLLLPFTSSWHYIASIPKLVSIPALSIALVIGVYILLHVLSTPITFAYSGDNCVSKFTIFPHAQQQVEESPFSISYQQKLAIQDIVLFSRRSCFELKQIASHGEYSYQTSPFGNRLAAQKFNINLPKPPKVSAVTLNKPIPLTKPVILKLSSKDDIFSYALQANKLESECTNLSLAIQCDLEKLELEQGQTYKFAVARYFANKPVETVVTKDAEILQATTVTDTSIKSDEVVLSKPTSLKIIFDKDIVKAQATMSRVDTQDPQKLTIQESIMGKELEIKFDELPRQAEFEVEVDRLVAQDESSLVEPYRLRFKTSGGPRVSGVNIPRAGVALGSNAVITFDQELSAEQDVASLVTFKGGSAPIYRSGNAVVVGLSKIGKCTDFTITIANSIQSIHGVDGNSAWSYNSRTICHTIEVYGQSAQGRPLVAYVFGSGSTTMLFTGGIHGNEASSSYLMDNWISELEANARNLPAGRKIIVIPRINPDGVAAGTRNNAKNVDLNRNFDVSDWKSDITDTYGNPIPKGGGVEPMSEPETKALAAYTSKLRPRLTMSFHSIGGLVIANQAGNSSLLASTYASLTGYRNATGQSSSTFDYAISGTYDDWIAEKLGLPSILVELGSHTYSQFPLNKNALWHMARW